MSRGRETLRITEIFHSIQGESSQMGRPCSFVRLTGCNLRCVWCDTAYAFVGGEDMELDEIVRRVNSHGASLVLVTGGEPLAQAGVHSLMSELLNQGKEVMIETGGSLDISGIDPRVRIVLDLKCPGSGMQEKNHWDNLKSLKPTDEIKFVLNDRRDYEWARGVLRERRLDDLATVLFSPVFGMLEGSELAEWILQDELNVRLQLQLHKLIWSPERRGV